ncbi:MAG: BLUF domain-containing protein [Aequorivita antarctica]
MIRTIVYISNAVMLLEKKHLDELFYQCVQNNISNNVTGILIYKEGTFIQVLEGNDQDLNNLFKTIQQDKRHNNIMTVLDRMNTKRLFTKFRTGLSSLSNARQLTILETFLRNSKGSPHSQTILALLGPFLNKKNTSMNVIN